MRFLDECINDSMPIWQECLNSEFLQKMTDGSLAEECFKGYIVDDSLYLREYSKVFAWGIINARKMDEICNYYEMLSFVNEGEGSTRKNYLKRYGLTDEGIQDLPPRAENAAYVKTMTAAARNGGVAQCMMATLPCMLSYRFLFKEIISQNPQISATAYGELVSDYESERYSKICDKWIEFAEQACKGLRASEKDKCLEIFRACSQHELHFWEMSSKPRDDI